MCVDRDQTISNILDLSSNLAVALMFFSILCFNIGPPVGHNCDDHIALVHICAVIVLSDFSSGFSPFLSYITVIINIMDQNPL